MERFDAEDLLERETALVFAVDQSPFLAGRVNQHIFSLLVPLATEGGLPLRDLDALFPRRGRVWWMLRPEIDPGTVVPGMLWTGTLELSQDFQTGKGDKDRYQVNRKTVEPGTRSFLEVIDFPEGEPALADLLDSGLPGTRPTAGRVLVRGPRNVLGPFRTAFDSRTGRIRLGPLNAGKPWVWRAPRSLLEKAVQEVAFTGGRWDPNGRTRDLALALLHERHLELLLEKGEKLDGATAAQVLNWGFQLLRLTKRDQQVLKDVLHRGDELKTQSDPGEFPGRRERFLELCANGAAIASLGVDAAETVAGQPAFRDLLERHKDALVARRVEEEVGKRKVEIARLAADEEERLQRLHAEIARLEEEYERRSRENEVRFRSENERRLRDLEAREAAAEASEKALREQEREAGERLQRVIASYREDAQKIGDSIVAQLPLLRRAGALGEVPAASSPVERPAALPLPAFLSKPRPATGMDERKFLEQFEHVVSRRGFAFEREDLVNFHVSVKVGSWTVLAGATGLGKSSLSRLYAEALGTVEEHLLIPVRPDWMDDRDVVGSFNALSGRYEPAPGGLVDRLIAAREDRRTGRGGIYIVCLDEMNLARVEHYFAAFLSILEQPPDRREIPLFASGLERPGDPYAAYRVLPLGDNVRFVGTVNIDETTHFFSPKVLDRASIVTLERPSLREGLAGAGSPRAALGGIVPIHLDEYRSWIAAPSSAPSWVLDLLVKVDEALRPARAGMGFRVRDRVLSYVASARGLIGEEHALDLALFANVAPRLRPNAPGWEEALRALGDLLPTGRFPRTGEVLRALAGAESELGFFQLL